MKNIVFMNFSAFLLLLIAVPSHAEVRATTVEKTYAVAGKTGIALYQSIGARGPRVRSDTQAAIATTNFDLKWGRDYEADGQDCVLVAARSFLTITYTMPIPSEKLPAEIAARWQVFIDGIRAHEAVHHRYIVEMAQQIYDTTVGFRQPNDPKCKAIRDAVQVPIKAAFDRYKERNRAFEQAEMAPGGKVNQLILRLVNGP